LSSFVSGGVAAERGSVTPEGNAATPLASSSESSPALRRISADDDLREAMIDALVARLRDDDADVRKLAALALSERAGGLQAAVRALQDALNDENQRVRDAAARALKQLAPTAADDARRSGAEPDTRLRTPW
jgi:HEAT repeat protein